MTMVGDVSEAKVYQGVATTIRALALRGRVVIVGRGGVYITRNMEGGVHLRLVAPLAYRAKFMAQQLGVDLDSANEYVRQVDRQRKAFYHRYWPQETQEAEAFTLTINTAVADEDRAVESVIPLVLHTTRVVSFAQIPETAMAGA
jgi:cytidylate kinase